MLVSGGKILAISEVNVDNDSLTGDGVAKQLGVNTNKIATKDYVNIVSGDLNTKIIETSSYVTTVSSNLQAEINKKIDEDVANARYMRIGSLSAGNGIDSTKLKQNIIEVSAKQQSVEVKHDNTLTGDGSADSTKLGVKLPTNMKDGVFYAYDKTGTLVEVTGVGGKTYYAGNYIYFNGADNAYINVSGLQPSGYYLSANALDSVSGIWNQVSAISGYGYSAWSAVSGVDFTKVATGNYLSANALDGLSGKWNEVSAISAVSGYGYSAWSAVSSIDFTKFVTGSYLSANALDELSGKWNEVSAISAVSGYGYSAWSAVSSIDFTDYVTSSLDTLVTNSANFLYTDGTNVQWSAVDLTSLGKMYDITSITPDLVSAGISANEQGNKFYVVSAIEPTKAQTPGISATTTNLSAWTSAINGKDYYLVSASPNGGTQQYTAGDWINSTALYERNTISVSGYKPLSAAEPLYFDVDDTTGDVTLKIDGSKLVTSKATVIANGYSNDSTPKVLTADGITATVPSTETPLANRVWQFEFGSPMIIQICINADFVPAAASIDMYDTVGFNGIQNVTNDIGYTMLGYATQHYNASTVTTIAAGSTVDFTFKIGSEGFLQEINNPCITIQQI